MDSAWIARLLVPARCPVCRGGLEPDGLICGACIRAMNGCRVLREDPPEGIDRIASCADHDGVPREILTAFKFGRLTGLSGLIAGFMADAAGPATASAILVPVPPARLRTWLRGFDPVGMLAAGVSARTGVRSADEPTLTRRGSGRQRGRGRAGRISDPPDIRPCGEAAKVLGGREVILVDDVMTTGATLSAAAAALRQSGATSISALTFTRRL